MYFNYNLSSAKFQALLRLYFLHLLIPADGRLDPNLSLALDRALVAFEGAA